MRVPVSYHCLMHGEEGRGAIMSPPLSPFAFMLCSFLQQVCQITGGLGHLPLEKRGSNHCILHMELRVAM